MDLGSSPQIVSSHVAEAREAKVTLPAWPGSLGWLSLVPMKKYGEITTEIIFLW